MPACEGEQKITVYTNDVFKHSLPARRASGHTAIVVGVAVRTTVAGIGFRRRLVVHVKPWVVISAVWVGRRGRRHPTVCGHSLGEGPLVKEHVSSRHAQSVFAGRPPATPFRLEATAILSVMDW